jgi:hypothetical protein
MANETYTKHNEVVGVYNSTVTESNFIGIVKTYKFSNSYPRKVNHLDGERNPRWKAEVAAGEQAGTTLHAYTERYNFKPYFMAARYTNPSYPSHWLPTERSVSGEYFTTRLTAPSVPSGLITKANNQALTKYISEANDARRVLQSGELIGEFSELVRQVSSPGKSLRNGLSAYVETVKKRTQRSSVRRLPKYRRSAEQAKLIKDTWLEYQFGWRPLVSEINSVIDYVNEEDPFSRHDSRRIQGVGVVDDVLLKQITHMGYSSGPPISTFRVRAKANIVIRYRGHLGMRPSREGYIAEKVGLHPTDWLPTLWELVPYSFLIDYFANIGDIITAASFPSGSLKWTMKTSVITVTTEFTDPRIEWYKASNEILTVFAAEPGHASFTRRTIDRIPYNGSFIPDWEFSIPGSGTKWLNMGALFLGSRSVEKLLK